MLKIFINEINCSNNFNNGYANKHFLELLFDFPKPLTRIVTVSENLKKSKNFILYAKNLGKILYFKNIFDLFKNKYYKHL